MRTISIGVMALATALVVLATTTAGAAEPAAVPTTLLNTLGIPQGVQRVQDALVNRNGNFPQLERKDPIRRIADPANLESDNPAIKTAAKIKKDQDLAKQKIKAIKHLSSVGCGCYPGVAEALLAALEDCTEEVRYEAAVAFCEAAGTPCAFAARVAATPKSCRNCTTWHTAPTKRTARSRPRAAFEPRHPRR